MVTGHPGATGQLAVKHVLVEWGQEVEVVQTLYQNVAAICVMVTQHRPRIVWLQSAVSDLLKIALCLDTSEIFLIGHKMPYNQSLNQWGIWKGVSLTRTFCFCSAPKPYSLRPVRLIRVVRILFLFCTEIWQRTGNRQCYDKLVLLSYVLWMQVKKWLVEIYSLLDLGTRGWIRLGIFPSGCEVTSWSTWSGCTMTCVPEDNPSAGFKVRTRSYILSGDANNPDCSASLEDILPCNIDPCNSEYFINHTQRWKM